MRKLGRTTDTDLPDKLLFLLLLLLLAERFYVFRELGWDYMNHGDDNAYIEAGYYFAKTGVISIWGPYPTAMIMPGMPVLIGLLSFLFHDYTSLQAALKLIWILMGVLTALAAYKSVSVFASKWAALYTAAHFLIPNMAWMNHLILTETPYFLLFTLSVYYTLQMGKSDRIRYFIAYLLTYMAALMFRANIIYLPLFTAGYLLLRKRNKIMLFRRGTALCGTLLLFVIPWTVRNYQLFDAFIPLTYGAGEPLLLGTYEGENYPEDEELNYTDHVTSVMRETYADYYKSEPESRNAEYGTYEYKYDPDGIVKELHQAQYLYHQECRLKALYRLKIWWQQDPFSLLKSYLEIKPHLMFNWVWAWECVLGVPYSVLHRLSQLNCIFCAATVILSLILKKYRKEILFLTVFFLFSVYIYSLAYVTDRYQSALLPLRYILVGFGFDLIIFLMKTAVKKMKRA